jgi:hypothetical protein
VYCGSISEKRGYVVASPDARVSPVERREITKALFHSLPVAGSVIAVPITRGTPEKE